MLKNYWWWRFSCMGIFALITAGCTGLSSVPPEQYNLSGHWQLNAAISDTPSLAGLFKRRQGPGGQGARAQGGGRAGPPPGGGGAGRGGGRGGQQSGAGNGSGQLKVPSLQSQQLDIQQDVESMGMKFDGANYQDVSWGKRKRGDLTVVTGWKDRDLVMKTTGGRVDIEERYVLSPNGQRLTVFVELDGGRNDLKFKRVFEKVVVKPKKPGQSAG